MDKNHIRVPKISHKIVQYSWVDPAYSFSIYVFARDGNIDGVFLEVVIS